MKLTNFEESEMERSNDVHVGEIDKYLEKEAEKELTMSDLAYEDWRDQQVEKLFNK